MTIIGLILEIIGVYYLSKDLFILNIWNASTSVEWAKMPFVLKSWGYITGIWNRDKLDKILLDLSRAKSGLQEFKHVLYRPFYGFALLLIGLIFQVIGQLL